MPYSAHYRPSTKHAELGNTFYDVVQAAVFPKLVLRHRDQDAALRVGLGELTEAEWLAHFGAFEPLSGSLPAPLALRYHGHQFRHYNQDLGDGRGFLFAQLYDAQDGRLLDLGTKGSGTTPWSRAGDGRLTLKGGVREVLATTMLTALGVNTSKSFSLIETGESLYRGDEPSPTRASVLVRLSHSHIRIGSFQRLAFHSNHEAVAQLMDHTIRTHMPNIWHDDLPTRTAAFLGEVMRRVARTGAQWMAAGFVHGVLNTDNINVTGESFDYGPWRFLPTYDAAFTAAYFDHQGLYAYGRQPETLLWNLVRLGGCLLPLAEKSALEAAIEPFWRTIQADFATCIIRRLGLVSRGAAMDQDLTSHFVNFLEISQAPFEQSFFDWFGGMASAGRAQSGPSAAFYATDAFTHVRERLADYRASPHVDLSRALFACPSPPTLLIDEVEAVWDPIARLDDWGPFIHKIETIDLLKNSYGLASHALAGSTEFGE